METKKLLILGLAAVALVAIVVIVLLLTSRNSSRSNDRRKAIIKGEAMKAAQLEADAINRRKQVSESLKEIDNKRKDKVPLETKLTQAGLTISKRIYIGASCGCGIVLGLAALIFLGRWYAAAALVIGGLGVPNWTLSYLREKRIKQFVQEFPSAIEVIIRGVKSGLPLGACLNTVAAQAREPVRGEFQFIVASMGVGFTIAESIERMAERVPLPETSFFSIVVNIQQKSGGNLTEALGNLAQVLRDRMTMELKVKALSSEAKSSAWIIGMLPLVVGGLVYLTTPSYLTPLWTTQTGQIVLSCIAIWMSIGVMTMRQMVNFKP